MPPRAPRAKKIRNGSLDAILVFSWFYIIVAGLVRVKIGAPVLFKQPRPGKIDPKTGREKKAFNILKGNMSIIGPHPQFVRDHTRIIMEQSSIPKKIVVFLEK